jgi:hypothetical protein
MAYRPADSAAAGERDALKMGKWTFRAGAGSAVCLGWPAREGGMVRDSNQAIPTVVLLLQQGQDALWDLVRLRHHGGTGLLQDLRARQVGGLLGKIRVHDARA